MRKCVAIVYSEPIASRYHATGEEAAERGVLYAVEAVHTALLELGYDTLMIPLLPPQHAAREKLEKLKADLVFNLFEGFPGYPKTEPLIPEILTERGIPYTGCNAETLRLALNKAKTKLMLKAAGIATPVFQVLTPDTVATFALKYPCIVKVSSEHASHGLSEKSLVHDFPALVEQVALISRLFGGKALVEEFLEGREFNITVMGNSQYSTLPPSEITYTLPPGIPKILTFAAKWDEESPYYKGTKAVCPAPIPEAERAAIAELAIKVFCLLRCRGYARVDMRRDAAGQLNVIEVNPNPDISPDTGAALQSEAAGLTYAQFIEKILALAMEI